MIQLDLKGRTNGPLTVLCLGAHSDDIEIGCGGTILKLAEQYPGTKFHWVVFNAIGPRQAEALRGAELFGGPNIVNGPQLKSFPDGFMPYVGADIKRTFEEIKLTVCPNIIFCTSRKDAHQDHRLIAELTWNTFRNHLILEYEIPKYDGDLGQPNVFVPLTPEVYRKKHEYLMEAFKSQASKPWFEESTFLSVMRLRGMECNAPSGYAEAFYGRKLVL